MIAVSLLTVLVVAALFGRTKFGLGLRAAAVNPTEARLSGVRVPAMLAVGWGVAAALGAVAGVLAAPSLLLEPNMMQTVLLYALAAAVLGGLDSPLGAVIGGLILGVFLISSARTCTGSGASCGSRSHSPSSSPCCSFVLPGCSDGPL